jgi:hypothetical protein
VCVVRVVVCILFFPFFFFFSFFLSFNSPFPFQITHVNEIIAAVKCANHIPNTSIYVMNGGHSYEGFSSPIPSSLPEHTQNTILLNLDHYNEVLHFDLTTNTIQVESGIRLGKFYGEVIKRGMGEVVVGGGTCETVGLVGHILCGGYGLLGRWIGFTSDQVLQFEIVSPHATLEIVNEKSHPSLFWSLRGSCSNAYGIIVSVTIAMRRYGGTFTEIAFPRFIGEQNVTKASLWFEEYAPLQAPPILTGTIHYKAKSMKIGHTREIVPYAWITLTYVGPKSKAIAETLHEIQYGLNGLLTHTEIENSYHELSFLNLVLRWTNMTSLDHLLNVTTLPPLPLRNRKCKGTSLLVYDAISPQGLHVMLAGLTSGAIHHLQWKAYGGVNRIARQAYWNERSPLRRGCLFEMHLSNCYVEKPLNSLLSAIAQPQPQHQTTLPFSFIQPSIINTTQSDLPSLHPFPPTPTPQPPSFLTISTNAELIGNLLQATRSLAPFIPTYPHSFPSYIDRYLPSGGVAYFGVVNAQKLQKMRFYWEYRKANVIPSSSSFSFSSFSSSSSSSLTSHTNASLFVFSTAASRFLYPLTREYIFVSSGVAGIATYRHENGKYEFVGKTFHPSHHVFLHKEGRISHTEESKMMAELGHVSYMASTRDGTVLYAVMRESPLSKNTLGMIGMYSIQGDGSLVMRSRTPTGGKNPNFLYLDAPQAHLYVTHGCGVVSMVKMSYEFVWSLESTVSQVRFCFFFLLFFLPFFFSLFSFFFFSFHILL